MIRSYACRYGQLEVLGLLYPFLGQISWMKRGRDENVGVLQVLVELTVVALFVICHNVLMSLSHSALDKISRRCQFAHTSCVAIPMLHYLILKELAQAELVLDAAEQILVLRGFACLVKNGYHLLFRQLGFDR